jgi:hypothetical protein
MRHSLMAKECKSMQGTPGLSREHGLATASAMPVVNSCFHSITNYCCGTGLMASLPS